VRARESNSFHEFIQINEWDLNQIRHRNTFSYQWKQGDIFYEWHIFLAKKKIGFGKFIGTCPVVDFINIKGTIFLYECLFGSFYYVHVTRKSCRNNIRTKICAYNVDEIDTWMFFDVFCCSNSLMHMRFIFKWICHNWLK
jgi:hypothetical protein